MKKLTVLLFLIGQFGFTKCMIVFDDLLLAQIHNDITNRAGNGQPEEARVANISQVLLGLRRLGLTDAHITNILQAQPQNFLPLMGRVREHIQQQQRAPILDRLQQLEAVRGILEAGIEIHGIIQDDLAAILDFLFEDRQDEGPRVQPQDRNLPNVERVQNNNQNKQKQLLQQIHVLEKEVQDLEKKWHAMTFRKKGKCWKARCLTPTQKHERDKISNDAKIKRQLLGTKRRQIHLAK